MGLKRPNTMNVQEAKEWLLGNRSTVNMVPVDPLETWHARVATADAASVQHAYWVVKADQTTPEAAHQTYAGKRAEYRSKRLKIAAVLLAAEIHHDGDDDARLAILRADGLMAANEALPIPSGAIP